MLAVTAPTFTQFFCFWFENDTPKCSSYYNTMMPAVCSPYAYEMSAAFHPKSQEKKFLFVTLTLTMKNFGINSKYSYLIII